MATTVATRQRARKPDSRENAQAANRRRRKRRRQKRRGLHFSVVVLFLVVVMGVLSLTVFFKIESVQVLGADKYLPEDIVAASGIQLGENMFRVRKKDIAETLKAEFPYIQKVEVRWKLPPKIELSITQEKPEGAIRQGDEVALISREGKILERGILLVPEDIPLIKGVNIAGLKPGEVLGEEAQEKLVMLQYLWQAVDESGFEDITNVDLTDRLNMRIMYENRIQLELGSEAELAYKLEFVKHVIENNLSPDDRGVLDVTEAYRKRANFRENADAEEDMVSLQEDVPASEEANAIEPTI